MGFFENSLKKWFYTNNSQAASTSARIPLLGASGNPIGSDTMANLASVLGVSKRTLTANDDANKIVEPGVYGVSNGVRPQNSPLIYNGVIVVFRNTFSKVAQVAFDYNYSKCFFRVIDVSSSPTYKDWVEITTDFPSFYKSYNSLSSLALALGGTNTTMPSSNNLNDFNVQGAWRIDAEQYTNVPDNIKVWCIIEVLNQGGSIIQRVTNSVTGDIYERINGGSMWKTWKRIVMTDI